MEKIIEKWGYHTPETTCISLRYGEVVCASMQLDVELDDSMEEQTYDWEL
ncbi:MAG: hypothetical protein IJ721_05505 [Bacteroidales bacterium]|nr:hypothetical protein [Bacteroidales bacterium]